MPEPYKNGGGSRLAMQNARWRGLRAKLGPLRGNRQPYFMRVINRVFPTVGELNALYAHATQRPANISHSPTIIVAAIQLTGFPFRIVSCARARHSAKTEGGTNLIAREIPNGIRIRSSREPITGMKSGIKSIGLRAYATMPATRSFAYHGVLGSRAAR